MCVVEAIEAILKTSKAIEKLVSTSFDDLPTVKMVNFRMVHNADGSTTYQPANLTKHKEGVSFLKNHMNEYTIAVLDCLKERVKDHSTELLTETLTILALKGWEKRGDASFVYGALDGLSTRFRVPLEKANVDCSVLQEEWDDMVDYAKCSLNLVQVEYQVLWWKLFNSVDSKKWSNIFSLEELLFVFPVSNCDVERVFSQLKIIKSERCTCIGEDRLISLLHIAGDAPQISIWDSSGAVECWQNDKNNNQ